MNQLVVSVITPSYNSVKYLPEAYASLKAQTFSKWEWIVVDDFQSTNLSNFFNSMPIVMSVFEFIGILEIWARLVQETLDLIWRRVNI